MGITYLQLMHCLFEHLLFPTFLNNVQKPYVIIIIKAQTLWEVFFSYQKTGKLNFKNIRKQLQMYYVYTGSASHNDKIKLCIYKFHTPTNALFIKLVKVLKFTLKITLTCSYMFRSTAIIREPSLEPS